MNVDEEDKVDVGKTLVRAVFTSTFNAFVRTGH
jgi:hypothetical protein